MGFAAAAGVTSAADDLRAGASMSGRKIGLLSPIAPKQNTMKLSLWEYCPVQCCCSAFSHPIGPASPVTPYQTMAT